MAKVYLGRALGEGGFEREVAIKLMHQHIANDPEFVAMFLDEARLAARIRHPNVVATVDVQRTDQGIFLVMDFIEGLSLDSLMRQQRHRHAPLLCEAVVRIVIDALQGLHAAHELTDRDNRPLNLVHRDVSPANVLVGTDGVSRITDFGVARAETRLASTRGGRAKGKLPYMAPEQVMDESIDRRVDVYAAGVVLWEALTLKRLFKADSEGALVQKVLAGAQSSARAENPGVPEAIDRVCMRALSVDPASRFSTALEMAEALEEAARVSGVTVAGVPRMVAFLSAFETNAQRMVEARRAAPGAPPVETPASVRTPASTTPSGSAERPGSASGRHLGPPTTASAALLSGQLSTGGGRRARSSHRGGLAVGIALGILLASVLIWVGVRLGAGDRSAAAGSGRAPASATEPGSAASAPASSAIVARAAGDSASSSAAAQGSALPPDGGTTSVRPNAGGHVRPGSTGSSAADFLPGTL
jgi:eukaryotic-like serine/threonine-protein kinase